MGYNGKLLLLEGETVHAVSTGWIGPYLGLSYSFQVIAFRWPRYLA